MRNYIFNYIQELAALKDTDISRKERKHIQNDYINLWEWILVDDLEAMTQKWTKIQIKK
jgi:hypothetical protein